MSEIIFLQFFRQSLYQVIGFVTYTLTLQIITSPSEAQKRLNSSFPIISRLIYTNNIAPISLW